MPEPCWKCFKFKTIEINKNNILNYPFLENRVTIHKKIQEHGYIRIWFCSRKENVCTTKYWAYMETDRNCRKGDF